MESLDILLVEDNEGDILLTMEAFEESKVVNTIKVTRNGEEAIMFFEALDSKAQHPDIVLLDVNLPKRNGHEVLMYIKTNDKFKSIPVIMLTTSSLERDIALSYKNHVNCYITKPIDVSDFMKAITKLEDFWINIVTIPSY
jgi:CheY-like chemotaxis protein